MTDASTPSNRESAAAQRRIHGAALGYQPMRMKPVHLATGFIRVLTQKCYRLEILNKASVPRVAPKLGARVPDEYVAEVLLPILVGEGRVNAVSPSLAMHASLSKVTPPGLLEELTEKEAFGRYAEPWEVANVMLFLASDLSSYLAGEVVAVSSQQA